jgi:hypothetical protein
MESIGLMPSHTGLPGGRKLGQRMTHYPIPDGPFLKIADRLLADRTFVITWYDRFPPRLLPPEDPTGAQPDHATGNASSRPNTPDWAAPAIYNGVVLGERPKASDGQNPSTDSSNRVR